jgi:diguanylate cyclase (GGDEF)-like protein
VSKKNGAPPATAVPDEAGGVDRLWKDLPALTWRMGQEDGQLTVRGLHSDEAVDAPMDPLGRLLRSVTRERGGAPFQLLEALPMTDGSVHSFLIVGFAIGGGSQAQYPQLAGVAIDVTGQRRRMEQLARQALADELTGLYNLRGFQLFAEHELKVGRRRQTRSAVVYIDLDGLKAVNDVHGHAAGDEMLVATATLLRKVYRECDVIARLGGDEFAVFASAVTCDPEDLRKRIRAEVPAAGLTNGHAVPLSMSIGVASRLPDAQGSLADMVAAADRSMYQDKIRKGGRLTLEAAAAALSTGQSGIAPEGAPTGRRGRGT